MAKGKFEGIPWREKRNILDQLARDEQDRHPPGSATYTQAAERVTARHPELNELASPADPHGFGPDGPPQAVEPFQASMRKPAVEGVALDKAVKVYQRQHPDKRISYGRALEIVLANDPALRSDYHSMAGPPVRE